MFKPAAYKFVFDRLNEAKTKGKVRGLIQIEVYFDRKRKYISTGIHVKPSEWDSKRGEIKAKHPSYETLNIKLKNQVKELRDIESGIEDFSLHKLSDRLKEGGRRITFIDFYEEGLNANTKLRPNTRRAQTYTLNVLKEFGEIKYFSELTYANIEKFDYYLREKGLVQSTIWGHHKQIKVYINLAIKKDLFKGEKNPYRNFKSKMPPSLRHDISPEELTKLENLKLDGKIDLIFEIVKDMFLFSCYSGLRFGDVQSLTPDNFEDTKEGLNLIIEQTEKTQKRLELPLYLLFDGKPQAIAQKHLRWGGKYLFERVSNPHANRILKKVAIKAGIDKVISYHYSRHTFGSLLAEYTKDPYLIMELMGHSKLETSMTYIHGSRERKVRRLQNIKWGG